MEADFDARPMVSDMLHPLLMGMSVVRSVADVVASLVERFAFASAPVLDAQRTTGVGEVDFQGFNGDALDSPGFVAAMPLAVYIGKKGAAAVRWASRALRVGWLPLTCRR
jgi:hypothetical protein